MKKEFNSEHYREDCSPIKCPKCEGVDFEERTKDSIDYTICEYEIRCKPCNLVIGYWAYGSFDPCFAYSEL